MKNVLMFVAIMVTLSSVYPSPDKKYCDGVIVAGYYNKGKLVSKDEGLAWSFKTESNPCVLNGGKTVVTDSITYKIVYK